MEEGLKQSEAKLRALHRHTKELAVAKTIEEVAKQTLDIMEFTLGFDVADFCIVEKDHIRVRGSRGMQAAPKLWEWPLDKPSVVVRSVYTKRTLRVPDTGKEPSFVDRRTLSGTEKLQLSELAAPVLLDNTVVGVLNVESSELNAFAEGDQELLETLATHVASALGRLRQVDALEMLVDKRTGELRESEERLRTIYDSARDGIVLADAESKRFCDGNKAFCEMLAVSLEELKTMGLVDIHPKEYLTHVMEQFEKLAKKEITLAKDIPVKRRDGSIFHADIAGSPMILGGRMLVLGLFRDVTERKEIDRLREQTTTTLIEDAIRRKELENMRNQFISAVTHELRTPLVSIKGYVDLTLEGSESMTESVQSNLHVVKRNTDRLLSLVNDLLDLSRMQAGRLELELQPVDFKTVIQSCMAEAKPLIEEKKLSVGMEVPDKPMLIQGDQVRLCQVLMNLLSNATKFSPEGSDVTLRVKEENKSIKVQVSDRGIGIRKENLARVFEPFSAIEKSTYVKGTGLGLSITKGLVEAHGGKIWAESEGEGKGATFSFTIPKRKEMV